MPKYRKSAALEDKSLSRTLMAGCGGSAVAFVTVSLCSNHCPSEDEEASNNH
jgi:hypothetical protein